MKFLLIEQSAVILSNDEENLGEALTSLSMDARDGKPSISAELVEVEMKSVTSSNIEAVGHTRGHNVLVVRFAGGGHYVYRDVPDAVFNDMMRAESIGGFFHNKINNQFQFLKLAER